MSQHLSEKDLERYLERTLRADDLLTFDAHMSECDPCFNKVTERTAAQASFADILADDTLVGDEHPSYEWLERYVDGSIDDVDKEIVDVHIRVCDPCGSQLYDLIQLRTALEIQTGAGATPQSSASSYWGKITANPFLRLAIPVFGVLFLGTILLVAWFLARRTPADIPVVSAPAPNVQEPANIELVNINADELPSNSNSSPPIVSLIDGGRLVKLDASGDLRGLSAPQFEDRVKSALTTQNIDISRSAKELRSSSGVLMGEGQSGSPFALTNPIGRIVESDRPQFRWRPLKDAEWYVVSIYDADFNKVAESPALRQPNWTAALRLKRGVVYQWQVTAVKDGQEIKSPVRPAPDAKFKVVDGAAANDIAAAKRQAGTSNLLLGILYANAGLLDEAERKFRTLLNQNPKSKVARKLLNKVRSAR